MDKNINQEELNEFDAGEVTETEVTETEETEETAGEENGGKGKTTQLVLTIRVVVGAYLVYLAYQIFTSENELTIPIKICAALFVVIGAALVIWSGIRFIKKDYDE